MLSFDQLSMNELFGRLSLLSAGEDQIDYQPTRNYEFGDVEWHEISWNSNETDLGSFKFKVMEDFGGEGMGDQYWFVFRLGLSDRDIYFKVSGYYASYDGGYYENISLVAPVDKVVTVWQ